MWDWIHSRLEAFVQRAVSGEVMEVVGRDDGVQPCIWKTPCLFCPRKSSSTSHTKPLQLISLLKYKYFSTLLFHWDQESWCQQWGWRRTRSMWLDPTSLMCLPEVSQRCTFQRWSCVFLWKQQSCALAWMIASVSHYFLDHVLWHWWKRRQDRDTRADRPSWDLH